MEEQFGGSLKDINDCRFKKKFNPSDENFKIEEYELDKDDNTKSYTTNSTNIVEPIRSSNEQIVISLHREIEELRTENSQLKKQKNPTTHSKRSGTSLW